jgi:hypothetical protein
MLFLKLSFGIFYFYLLFSKILALRILGPRPACQAFSYRTGPSLVHRTDSGSQIRIRIHKCPDRKFRIRIRLRPYMDPHPLDPVPWIRRNRKIKSCHRPFIFHQIRRHEMCFCLSVSWQKCVVGCSLLYCIPIYSLSKLLVCL